MVISVKIILEGYGRHIFLTYIHIYGEKTETPNNQKSPVLALRKKFEIAFHPSKVFFFTQE